MLKTLVKLRIFVVKKVMFIN